MLRKIEFALVVVYVLFTLPMVNALPLIPYGTYLGYAKYQLTPVDSEEVVDEQLEAAEVVSTPRDYWEPEVMYLPEVSDDKSIQCDFEDPGSVYLAINEIQALPQGVEKTVAVPEGDSDTVYFIFGSNNPDSEVSLIVQMIGMEWVVIPQTMRDNDVAQQ